MAKIHLREMRSGNGNILLVFLYMQWMIQENSEIVAFSTRQQLKIAAIMDSAFMDYNGFSIFSIY